MGKQFLGNIPDAVGSGAQHNSSRRLLEATASRLAQDLLRELRPMIDNSPSVGSRRNNLRLLLATFVLPCLAWGQSNDSASAPQVLPEICAVGQIASFVGASDLITLSDGALNEWRLPQFALVNVLTRPGLKLRIFELSTDGQMLAAASDQDVFLVDTQTREIRQMPKSHRSEDDVRSLGFSEDGRLLAVTRSYGIQIFDTKSDHLLRDIEDSDLSIDNNIELSQISSSDVLAVATADHSLKLWSLSTGALLGKLPRALGHTENIVALAFSHKGNLLASADQYGNLILWDIQTKSFLRHLDSGSLMNVPVAFAPDDLHLAVGVAGPPESSVAFWNTQDGTVSSRFIVADAKEVTAHGGWNGLTPVITFLLYENDGKRLVAADQNSRLYAWDLDTGKPIQGNERCLGAAPEQTAAVIFNLGHYLATVSRDETFLRLWDLTGTSGMRQLDGNGEGLWAVDGIEKEVAAVGFDGALKVWDIGSGRLRPISQPRHPKMNLRIVRFNSKGTQIAAGGDGNFLDLWNSETGKVLWSNDLKRAQIDETSALFFSPYKKQLLSTGSDGHIRVWNTDNGMLLKDKELLLEEVRSAVMFDPTEDAPFGILAFGGMRNRTQRILLLNSKEDYKVVRDISLDVPGFAESVAVSQDAPFRIYAGGEHGQIGVMDFDAGNTMALPSFGAEVTAIASSPLGKRFVTVEGNIFRILDPYFTELGRLQPFGGGDWLVFTPRGEVDGTPRALSGVTWRFADGRVVSAQDSVTYSRYHVPGLLKKLLGGDYEQIAAPESKPPVKP